MLESIFELRNAINEGALGGYNNVGYQFLGDEEECFNEAALAISENVANLMEYDLECDRMLVENFSDNSKFEPLLEASIQGALEKIKQFFAKLKKIFIGILDRVKAFFFKMVGKTDKWLQVMKPRIDAASSRSGIEEVEVEVYDKLNSKAITDGLFDRVADKFDNLLSELEKISDGNTIPFTKESISALDDRESFIEDTIKSGFNGKTLDELLDLYKEEISESTTKSVDDVKNSLLDYIQTYKKTRDSVKTTLTKVIQRLNTLETKFSKLGNKIGENRNNYTHVYGKPMTTMNGQTYSHERENVSDDKKEAKQFVAYVEAYSQICGKLSKAMSELQSIHLSQMKKALNTYMNALTKYAYYKAPKTA